MLTVPTVGVSLKAYLGFQDSLDWLRQTASALRGSAASLFVMPSFPALPQARAILDGTGIGLGAQDVSSVVAGAATGEVPARMLAEIGCEFAEVGHSERRRRGGESDADVAAKCLRAVEAGLSPVICVGEAVRVAAEPAVDFTSGQLARRLAQLPPGAEVVVAYEPEWAIGADAAAEPARIAEVTGQLRQTVAAAGLTGRVLYGGSANTGVFAAVANSAVSAAQLPDGLFVGRAALDVERLRRIVDEVLAVTPADAR
jgi:triosephosphate isomerase